MTTAPSLTLDPEPASAGAARRFVRSHVPAGFDVDAVELLTSELVANVVDHAGTPVTLTVDVEASSVRVTVIDGEAATDAFRELVAAPPAPVPASSPRGRGLGLVKSLAADVGLTDLPTGKAVWFRVDRRP